MLEKLKTISEQLLYITYKSFYNNFVFSKMHSEKGKK